MNKNILSVYALLFSSASLFASAVMAESSYYVSAQVGGAISSGKLAHEVIVGDTIKKRLKTAPVFNANAGVKLCKNTYGELEIAYANHKFRDNYNDIGGTVATSFRTKVRTISGFANLNYRFNDLSKWAIPYVTAGFGASSNKVDKATLSLPSITTAYNAKSKTKTSAAWQVGAGVLVPVTKMVSMNLSYKYRNLGKINDNNELHNSATGAGAGNSNPVLKGRLKTHNVLLGVNIDL